MNLVDCVVTKVLGEPYYLWCKWMIDVQYEDDCSIQVSTMSIVCNTKEEAESIKVGYKFLA